MGHYLTLIVLWTVFSNVTPEFNLNEDEMKEVRARFCGSNLSNTLSILCRGEYNTGRKKKSMFASNNVNGNGADYVDDVEPLEYSEEPILRFPFRSKERAKSLIPIEFRKRRGHGVTDECCYKSCSLYELSTYCSR